MTCCYVTLAQLGLKDTDTVLSATCRESWLLRPKGIFAMCVHRKLNGIADFQKENDHESQTGGDREDVSGEGLREIVRCQNPGHVPLWGVDRQEQKDRP